MVLAALLVGVFLAAVDQTAVASALPTIAGELGGLDQVAWVVATYLLTQTVSTPLYGRLSDMYGRRRLYLFAITIFVFGSAGAALAVDLPQLIAARAVQGAGAGGLISLAQVVLGDLIPPRERGRYSGWLGGVFAVASLGGPLLGGVFVDAGIWRAMFLVNIPVALVAALVIVRALRGPIGIRRRVPIDYLGTGLFVIGAGSVLLGLSSLRSGFGAPTAGTLVGGLVLLTLFAVHELRTPHPLLPLRSLADRTIVTSAVLSFATIFAMLGSLTFLPIYLQVGHGFSATVAGLLLVPQAVAVVAGNIMGGRLVTRTGRYRTICVTGSAMVTAALVVIGLLPPGAPIWLFVAAQTVLGLGIGTVSPLQIVVAQNAAVASEMGVVTASVIFFRSVGGTLGVAVLGTVLAAGLHTVLVAPLAAVGWTPDRVLGSPAQLASLPAELQARISETIITEIGHIVLIAAAVAAVGLLISLSIIDRPLRESVHSPDDPVTQPGTPPGGA
ncbi:MDR family MFS transporter [Pseudonocardia sp. NPDC049635]|uniref:MDR family MFS transporter n=1 Tax=Pseudonocardia sp. NPDC049635 TaxID=3155506 RepID=UPI0033DB3031